MWYQQPARHAWNYWRYAFSMRNILSLAAAFEGFLLLFFLPFPFWFLFQFLAITAIIASACADSDLYTADQLTFIFPERGSRSASKQVRTQPKKNYKPPSYPFSSVFANAHVFPGLSPTCLFDHYTCHFYFCWYVLVPSHASLVVAVAFLCIPTSFFSPCLFLSSLQVQSLACWSRSSPPRRTTLLILNGGTYPTWRHLITLTREARLSALTLVHFFLCSLPLLLVCSAVRLVVCYDFSSSHLFFSKTGRREREESHANETAQLIAKLQSRIFALENKLKNPNVPAAAAGPVSAGNPDLTAMLMTSLLQQLQQPHHHHK